MNPISLTTRKREQLGEEWAREGSVSYAKYGNGWGRNALKKLGKDRRKLRSRCGSRQEWHSYVLKAADLSFFKVQGQRPESTAKMNQPDSGNDPEFRYRHRCDGG